MGENRDEKSQALVQAIDRRGGVARRKDLVALGFTTWDFHQGEAQGLLRAVARGHYALPHANPADIWLANHQARRTCLSKVADLGLWLLVEPRQTHVAAAHGRPVAGCLVHRVSGGQSMVNILRQCVQCGTQLEALVVLESAVVKKKCTIGRLRREFNGREDTAGRAIVAMIDPQSMSITETCGRYHLRQAGYNVQGQAFIKDAGHLDLLVEGVLGIETDGEKYHNTPEGWAEDLRRDTMYVLNGIWRLRIPAAVVLYHPELMLRWVEQALAMIRSK
ncbi:type IV toxin-antitoxin system AbiEi family antitoxin domain-containing protein [Arthrobacter glacialis]|uniref:type IV toxin-antitoxin system AbiEi family antitoxin domain-containing protein n=1 Tax=Arthrobacter glacialis TaxID=1664 RepID=UPI000CD3CE9F|nr:type IV toxin-antitoxin system AbiEi family antitoxin domain-containing protein [Arthrobacter glacialis]POH60701.1 hypothetical protein CVS28_03280 [Arthrobacter glacialis]